MVELTDDRRLPRLARDHEGGATLRKGPADISLARITEQMPIREDAEPEHYLEAFRRAELN